MKFNNLSLFLLAGVIGFSSCGKDEETPAKVLPTSFTAKLLGAQGNSNGSFFSPKTGLVYPASDKANFITNQVDISFAQTGDPTSPKFIALSGRAAEGLTSVIDVNRATTFTLTAYTKAQFDTVSNAFVANLSSGGTAAVEVQQGKVYKFINAEDKAGLIYVSNLDLGSIVPPATSPVNGSVSIDVKFEK